jgi:hypothetical protein
VFLAGERTARGEIRFVHVIECTGRPGKVFCTIRVRATRRVRRFGANRAFVIGFEPGTRFAIRVVRG